MEENSMSRNTEKFDKKEYEKKAFKYQNVCFKMEEMKEIEAYCKENKIAKNTLIREAVMERIKAKN